MAAVALGRIRAFLDHVLSTEHVGEMFVRAFRWLVNESDHLEGMRQDVVIGGVRKSDQYRDAEAAFAAWLGASAAESGIVTRPASTTLVPGVVASLRTEIRTLLLRTSTVHEIFPVVLAFLDVIDQRFGRLLVDEFYRERRGASEVGIPISPAGVFPKPWPAFGTDAVAEPRAWAPRQDRPDEYLYLSDYFGVLGVTLYENATMLAPALHVRSRRRSGRHDDGIWRVAMLSILADHHDVDWEKDDYSFWGCGLSEKVRTRVQDRLQWALQVCEDEGADIILIPELNVDPEIERSIVEWIESPPREPDQTAPLVIYGATHASVPGEAGYRNRPHLRVPAGPIPWDYWKVHRVFTSVDFKGEQLWEALGPRPPHVLGIDLPIGRLAVVVCKDFLEEPFRPILAEMQANVLVVLAMTSPDSVLTFREYARTFASSTRSVTLLCNSSIHQRAPWRKATSKEPRTLGLVHVNTRVSRAEIATHELRDEHLEAVVGLYTLQSSEDGLTVTVKVFPEDATPVSEVERHPHDDARAHA